MKIASAAALEAAALEEEVTMGRTIQFHRGLGRCSVALLTALVLVLPFPPALAQIRETSQGKQWKVKCESSTQGIEKGSRLRLTVGPEKIVVTLRGKSKDQDKIAFTIPITAVLGVDYFNTKHSPAAEGWDSFWSGLEPGSGEEAIGALVLLPVLGGVWLALDQFKEVEHFVVISWQEQGKRKHMLLKTQSGEHKSLLAELGAVAGKEWRNIPEEIEKARQEVELGNVKRQPLLLHEYVNISDRIVPPGRYVMVLLEREPDLGELYLFSGDEVNAKNFAGRFVVEILTGSPRGPADPLASVEERRAGTISQLLFGEKKLRFLTTPVEVQAPPAAPPDVQPAAATPPPVSPAPPSNVSRKAAETRLFFHSIAVTSQTVWFKPKLLQQALPNADGFKESGIQLAKDEKLADVVVQVNRPLFTFDWTYTLVHRETGTSLGNGKVTAWDSKAASPKLATEILKQLKVLRPGQVPEPLESTEIP